ncbi:helicase associated domain-containing protein [Arthrobacter sp. B3I4]|uniref:helicase associated domain-containing protein n=1 Tax=Arthrobacter sp. B3I4 TaxID=3042267 RepID=UPI002788A0DC|nr:helicase associated domain-containing protein [Arthrobacter sp. B3I4]MDQ0756096.1 hypothetical protein [Arthrobacter sp. B3I4]
MTAGGSFRGRESLHPEWDLMYRKGLTVARIADLCSVVRQTVGWHIRAQRALHPDMEAEHLANRPAQRPRPPSGAWLANLRAVAEYWQAHERYPTTADHDGVARGLGQWLMVQRARLRAGTLPEDRQQLMSVLPGWADNQRARLAGERWKARLGQLIAFRAAEGRWPTFRAAKDEQERVLGVWLHAQRQAYGTGRLTAEQLGLLDEVVPGWNAWRVKHLAKRTSGR